VGHAPPAVGGAAHHSRVIRDTLTSFRHTRREAGGDGIAADQRCSATTLSWYALVGALPRRGGAATDGSVLRTCDTIVLPGHITRSTLDWYPRSVECCVELGIVRL
jgi:hypothetical protein